MDQATRDRAIARIREYAELRRDLFEVPGFQFAVTDRDQLLGTFEVGYANVDAKEPVTPETMFQIGSIGKSFTAICLLQLATEGKVDLHAPFETQLPWWAVKSAYRPITAHDLLSHSSGVVSGTDFTPEQRYEVWSMRNTETFAEPGTVFHYSNVAYKALGLLIEHVTGKSYGEVVQDRILDPLGMTNTIPIITNDDRHRLAVGYQNYFDDRPRVAGFGMVPAPWLETDSGDGCICANAADLATYLRMFMNRGAYPGGHILSEQQFATMSTPRIVSNADENQSYGYGVEMPTEGAPGKFGHGGGMVGFISAMTADFTAGYGVIVFTNSINNVSRIADFALDVFRAADANESFPEPPGLPTDAFVHHAGTYVGRTGTIEIVGRDGEFVLVRDGAETPLTKTLWHDGDLVDTRPVENLFPYAFETKDDGTIARVVHGADEWVPEGEPLPEETNPDLQRLAGHYRANNPWQPNFRIVARGNRLYRAFPDGSQQLLVRMGDAWTGDSDEEGPEKFWIDVFVDGLVARVRDQLGSSWERVPGL